MGASLAVGGLFAGGVAVYRLQEEPQECFVWCKLVQHTVHKARNPIKFMPQTVMALMDPDAKYTKVRMFGLAGPHIIFARDASLITHVTQSEKYRRVNPLDSQYFPGSDFLTRATGMKGFLDGFLAQSIWFQPSGEVHARQRELFLSFVPKFLTQDAQGDMYKLLWATLQERIDAKGPKADLFDLLQEVVSVVQLHFISDYKLPADWTVEKYCSVTNSAFGGLYSFTRPSQSQQEELEALTKHMLENSGDNGLVKHMRKNSPKEVSEAAREQELLHNLMAGLFLGQQSLANAAFWLVRNLFQNKKLLETLRMEPGMLPLILKEELRVHPPSSPFLMPYLCLDDDCYESLVIRKGSIVAMMPILVHLNENIWRDATTFDNLRFADVVESRRASFRDASFADPKGGVPVAEVHAAMVQNGKLIDGERCPVTGKTIDRQSHTYCPFGVGKATCPMQGFSIGVICNLVTAIVRDWDVDIHDDLAFSQVPVEEHVTVDTGSRPALRLRATFKPRQMS